LKEIVHFYNPRDALPMCCPAVSPAIQAKESLWPAPESTVNMNTTKIGNLRLNNAEEDALVSFMRTLSDGYMPRDQKYELLAANRLDRVRGTSTPGTMGSSSVTLLLSRRVHNTCF
jgi:hypothetical protein